jgi:hypothetical protein
MSQKLAGTPASLDLSASQHLVSPSSVGRPPHFCKQRTEKGGLLLRDTITTGWSFEATRAHTRPPHAQNARTRKMHARAHASFCHHLRAPGSLTFATDRPTGGGPFAAMMRRHHNPVSEFSARTHALCSLPRHSLSKGADVSGSY